ncbi:MAG: DUF371 domain-containing protein [Thermoprotei archaeon]|nr:MAG: DUF371 domain-containing protein [Thermoprotei archaeon]
MIAVEVVRARGHPLIRAAHRSTFEVTREPSLTPRGDCIIGIAADKAPAQFSQRFKELASSEGALILIVLRAGGVTEVVRARGDSRLRLSSLTSMVVRRSRYVDDRTVAVESDKAAAHLDRRLVELLRRGAELEVLLVAYTPGQEGEALRAAGLAP